MSGYDVIGDVHGQGSRLESFLRGLGYGGAYFAHPDGRKAIFIGDLTDRGTEHAKVFDIVRRMNAKVIMGNHELNAIAYAQKSVRGGYVRSHTEDITKDHADFLAEYPFGSAAHKEVIDWFRTFPIYHEAGGIRLIHACWSENAMAVCRPYLRHDKSPMPEMYQAYDRARKGSGVRWGLDLLLKGPELSMPKGVTYRDIQGNIRDKTRLYWWKEKDTPDGESFQFSQDVIDRFSSGGTRRLGSLRKRFNYSSQSPVLFGHYNIDVQPFLASSYAGCVNFKNRLVAYRWDAGDKALSPQKLVHD